MIPVHIYLFFKGFRTKGNSPPTPPHPFAPTSSLHAPAVRRGITESSDSMQEHLSQYKGPYWSHKRSTKAAGGSLLSVYVGGAYVWVPLHNYLVFLLAPIRKREQWSWSRQNVLSPEGVHMCVKPARKCNSTHCEGWADTQRRSQTDRNRFHVITV